MNLKSKTIFLVVCLSFLGILVSAGAQSVAASSSGEDHDLTLSTLPGLRFVSPGTPAAQEPYRTAPADIPRFDVAAGTGTPGDGYIFLSPFTLNSPDPTISYLMILDNNGEPVYYDRQPGLVFFDFKRQPGGNLTFYDNIAKEFREIDQHYQVVRTYRAGNGYTADLHDLQFLDNGHYLLLIYDTQIVDMSALVEGGNPEAEVTGCVVQELDASDEVVFQWRSWDHMAIRDSSVDLTKAQIDYVHCNSIAEDFDGDLILSSRNLSEVTKIDRKTGAIVWRLGGKQNEFAAVGDVTFDHQHDARRLENGHLTLFDNGLNRQPPRSRGLELAVDELNKTVTLVREFRNTPDSFGSFMGSMQRLPNGDSLIDWGYSNKPVFTEFSADGDKVLEFSRENFSTYSYRAFRFPWQGFPDWPPELVASAQGQEVTLYFSWNGSTDVAGYDIFARDPKGQEMLLGQVDKEGFENTYSTKANFPGPWTFWVAARDEMGEPLALSEEVVLLPDFEQAFMPVVHSGS